jgi:hypothetical protein
MPPTAAAAAQFLAGRANGLPAQGSLPTRRPRYSAEFAGSCAIAFAAFAKSYSRPPKNVAGSASVDAKSYRFEKLRLSRNA